MIDILIIGSGGAGLTTALEAKKSCDSVVVLSKTTPTASQTCQAQGGINAVINNSEDSQQNHIDDTIKSAHNLGDKETIEYMCKNSEQTIKWLDDIGVPFSRDKNNNIAQRKLGGASFPRACYSSDYTGLKILHTLYDTCLKNDIKFINEHMLLNFIVENGEAKGITCIDIETSEIKQILAKKVIVASGGYGGIYNSYNTNSTATTGDAISSALRVGCRLSNMEYIQFHPTSMKDSCILISESARGEGGYLVTKDEERFVDELQPRDIVARAIYTKIEAGDEVFLDLRHLGKQKIMESMPQEYDLALQFMNKKLDEDLIPITPAAHYTMGGIKTDIDGKTNIKNLYAVGECSSNGVHGANRLGGNSLLEIITFGKLVASDAIKNIDDCQVEEKEYDIFLKDKKSIENIFECENKINFYDRKVELGELFYQDVGLFREEKKLNIALERVAEISNEIKLMGISDKSRIYNTNLKEFIEFKNMIELSQAIVISALNRKESRGAHYRVEFQDEDEKFARDTVVKKIDDRIVLEGI
ncbi:MAG: FAD-dependent oxidoreductase [Campylobacterota bacterium]|nr:FAD-dependent oxidoreductase [Campylobacterota bacterium]